MKREIRNCHPECSEGKNKETTFTAPKKQTMKLFLTSLLGLILFTAQAQTADEIVQKHAATMGGLDAMNKISSYKITGTVTAQGNELPIVTQVINGKSSRIEVEVMGQSIITVYDNGKGWTINPFTGATEATDITGSQLTDIRNQAFLASNLVDYKNRGYQLESAGQEDVDGVKCFKLKLTNKDDGKITFFFINATNYVLIKAASKREMQGQEVDTETFYSDLKEVNGIKYFMSRVQKMNGEVFSEMHVEKIELNVPVDESIFKKQ